MQEPFPGSQGTQLILANQTTVTDGQAWCLVLPQVYSSTPLVFHPPTLLTSGTVSSLTCGETPALLVLQLSLTALQDFAPKHWVIQNNKVEGTRQGVYLNANDEVRIINHNSTRCACLVNYNWSLQEPFLHESCMLLNRCCVLLQPCCC